DVGYQIQRCPCYAGERTCSAVRQKNLLAGRCVATILALCGPLAASKSEKRERFLAPRHYCFFFTEDARFGQHPRVYECVRGYVGMSDVFSYERLESLFRGKKAGVQATSGRDLRVLI